MVNKVERIGQTKDLKEIEEEYKLKSFMERLKTLTDFIGMKSQILPPSENTGAEQLVISLSENDEDTMQIMFITDLFKSNNESVILQIISSLNSVVSDESIVELSGLITRANPILPVGSFGLTGANNLYLRQTIMGRSKDLIDLAMVVETIDIIAVFINLIGIHLKAFIDKKITFDECLEKIQNFNQQPE